ncbi:MAG: phosphate ABC transporter substrate-binding protein PstS [Campylobacterales bacterium]|nr:phosphate ABC transporter substrate-binding protein PstS [Campylobacterales bacterium]
MKKLVSLTVAGLMATATLNATDLKGSGASFPYSVYQKWIKEYNAQTGIKVDYIKKGSSKGIKDAVDRSVDFGGTDKPLSPKDLQKSKLYQFPAVVGAITMAYNVPNLPKLNLTRAAIAEIAMGNVEYWDDAVIAVANPGVKLPHEKLTFVHRADGSGTTFNFTYYLSKSNSEWKEKFGAKKSLNWPGNQHIGGKTNTGVAALIKQTPFAIGYIDYADAISNDIAMANVQNKEGYFIKPELSSFQEAAAKAELNPANDFYATVADPDGKGVYPIIASTFILLPQEATAKNKDVTKFYDWAFKHGQDIAKSIGFVPLPDSLTNKIRTYWSDKGVK